MIALGILAGKGLVMYVPTPEDYDADDAAEMQAACVGEDLSGPATPPAGRAFGLVAIPTGIKSSARNGATVSLICGHTAEGARTARSLAAYFARPEVQASSHVVIDAAETLLLVPYSRAAWTLRSGNPISDNAEICGFARWTREQWLSTGTVDGCVNPRAMLDRFAAWVSARCKARGIPVRRLSLAQVRSRTKGVIHHDDWTKAMNDGSHWDCGPGFPWDYVLNRARGAEEDDMAPRDWSDADKRAVGEALVSALIADPTDGGKKKPFGTWLRYRLARRADSTALAKRLAGVKAELAAHKASTDAKLAEILEAVRPKA